jgi:hypothetical protein
MFKIPNCLPAKVLAFTLLWCSFFFGKIQNTYAQSECLQVPVLVSFQYKPLVFNDTLYTLKNNHKVKFETLKFYLSSVTLIKNTIPVWKEDESFHLIDFEDVDSNALCLEIPDDLNFDAIQFNLGIDSLTNVSGALGGDLDPTKGMYWTWQNGYINFKLEGTSDLCHNPKNEFQFHLGGYTAPWSNVQKIKLNVANTSAFNLTFNLDQFINELDLQNLNHIMSPSQAAVDYAKLAAKCFSNK